MKYTFKSVFRSICVIVALLASGTSSCSNMKIKTTPAYTGVDPRVQSYVDEFMWLGRQNNILFKNRVTIGFTDISYESAVGLCTSQMFFREIDLDSLFWLNSSQTTKMSLAFHELAHCYCERDHDYSKKARYRDIPLERVRVEIYKKMRNGPVPGYFADGCPSSLLHPLIVDDDCMFAHYSHYVTEMFDRCRPW